MLIKNIESKKISILPTSNHYESTGEAPYIKCCRNCKDLNYYDGYFCSSGKALSEANETEVDYTINDIQTERCEMFSKRYGKFWLGDDGEF